MKQVLLSVGIFLLLFVLMGGWPGGSTKKWIFKHSRVHCILVIHTIYSIYQYSILYTLLFCGCFSSKLNSPTFSKYIVLSLEVYTPMCFSVMRLHVLLSWWHRIALKTCDALKNVLSCWQVLIVWHVPFWKLLLL